MKHAPVMPPPPPSSPAPCAAGPDVSGGQINAATDLKASSTGGWAGYLQAAQLSVVLWIQEAQRKIYGRGTCHAGNAANAFVGCCPPS
jgi:hypothetical protein